MASRALRNEEISEDEQLLILLAYFPWLATGGATVFQDLDALRLAVVEDIMARKNCFTFTPLGDVLEGLICRKMMSFRKMRLHKCIKLI